MHLRVSMESPGISQVRAHKTGRLPGNLFSFDQKREETVANFNNYQFEQPHSSILIP